MPELNFTDYFNPQTEFKDITSTCFEWCRDQSIIHQSNIDIQNLGVIVVALFALLLYNISVDYADQICNSTRLSKDTLRGYGNIIVFFAFVLLAGFLAYYALIN